MSTDNIYSHHREMVIENERLVKRIKTLEQANMELTAALTDRGEELKVHKELAHGVLLKSVDRYLQAVDNSQTGT